MKNIIDKAQIFISNINKKYKIKFAYVFGSQATGKAFFKKNVDIVSLEDASLLLKYEIIHDGILIKDDDARADFGG